MFNLHGQPWGDIFIVTTISQIEYLVFWREYGLTPSITMLNWRLCTSSLKLSGHVSSIWFMPIESVWIHLTLGSPLCEVCHPFNIANCLQWNTLWILGIMGMCLNILWGGPCALPFIYLFMVHVMPKLWTYVSIHIFIFVYNIIIRKSIVWYVLITQHFHHFLCYYAVIEQAIITQKYLIFE